MNKIGIIGYGHLGKALKKGLIRSGIAKESIFVANTQKESKRVVSNADLLFITVKPKDVFRLIRDIREEVKDKILISAAAAVSIAHISKSAKYAKLKIIRIMPNLPIAHQQGVIGLYANKYILPAEKKKIIRILTALGKVIECKRESEIDAMTILSGSGPAITAYYILLMIKAGMSIGLSKLVSEQIALQTVKGTITTIQESQQTVEELQNAVATKGGITETILRNFNDQNIPNQFVASMERGYGKIKRIKEEL